MPTGGISERHAGDKSAGGTVRSIVAVLAETV